MVSPNENREEPDEIFDPVAREVGDEWAGDRRIARGDSALPDWYISDAAYRPIPIAWFAGALVLQTIGIVIIFAGFSNSNGYIMLGAAALMTCGNAYYTWSRGMKNAGLGWNIATLIMLLLYLGLVALVAIPRM